jgi:hypothetical protein
MYVFKYEYTLWQHESDYLNFYKSGKKYYVEDLFENLLHNKLFFTYFQQITNLKMYKLKKK